MPYLYGATKVTVPVIKGSSKLGAALQVIHLEGFFYALNQVGEFVVADIDVRPTLSSFVWISNVGDLLKMACNQNGQVVLIL